MALTGKQKRDLKARGQKLADDFRVGNSGLTDGALKHLDELLRRRELVKVRFGEGEGAERGETARNIAAAAGAELVGVVGRTLLVYRANPDLPADQRALTK